MRHLLYIICLFSVVQLSAQQPLAISAYWDDSFEEWIIYTDDEAIEGQLQPRWLNRGDWTEWDWQLGDESISIKQLFDNDPTQWEVRGFGGDLVTCRAAWKGDLSEWRVTNNSINITFRTRYGNNVNEWVLRDKTYGEFIVHTDYQNDPRDWIIIDEVDERISPNMKIAMIFLAIYHSVPKI